MGDQDLETYKSVVSDLFRVLKQDKFMVVFVPIGRLREFIEITEGVGFQYVWLGVIYYRNIQRLLHTRLGRNKISLYLVFEKGRAKRKYAIRDVVEIIYTPKNTKEFCHPAQKPIKGLMDLMRFGSSENDLVLDPFVGSGTTCIVAKKLNRNYVGIEINPDYCELAEKRLHLPMRLESFQTVGE